LGDSYDFSFSGLKTAVLRLVQKHENQVLPVADICASFQAAVVDVLVGKAMRAAEETGATTLALAGGVAANRSLRERMKSEAEHRNWQCFVPPLDLCTDNAAMIGGLAYDPYNEGVRSPLDLRATSRLPL
ncbi:MAG TPA: carbamoyltransferase N-terminal domain-containing protein, partial [Chroococcales cyanobacterium]